MMSDTPRVFVGTTTFLLAAQTSQAGLTSVTAVINGFPGVVGVAADQLTGLLTLTADLPVNRADLTAAITQAGYTVLE